MAQRAAPRFERVRHFQGQRVLARDLADEYANADSLRSLHVIGLHDTWGIAVGLEAYVGPDGGFIVGPGLAYDVFGREIVVASPVFVASPTSSQPGVAETDWVLCLTRDEEIDQGSCSDERQSTTAPEILWRQLDAVKLGIEVPLLSARIGSESVVRPGAEVRRYTERQARPRIASGVTPAAQRWSLWTQTAGEQTYLRGVETLVETTSAGFVRTPHYIAMLHANPQTVSGGWLSPRSRTRIFGHVADATPLGFVYRLRIIFADAPIGVMQPQAHDDPNAGEVDLHGVGERAPGARSSASSPSEAISSESVRGTFGDRTDFSRFPMPFRVAWAGVEPLAGCGPSFDLYATYQSVPRLHTRTAGVQRLDVFSHHDNQEAIR